MKKKNQLLIALASVVIVIASLTSSCTKDKVPVPLEAITCNDTISFSQQIAPMIQNNCASCHGSGAGTNPVLSNYSEISSNSVSILNTLKGTPQLMPQGGPALADSLIQQFQCWIQQGKKDN
jgi:hypothetical protein